MRSLLTMLICFSLFFYNKTNGQEIKDYVLNHTTAVNSISISDTNYSDLLPLAQAIGNSRIVLLGEQDHGDAPTFLAKGRLIKFLHEKLGFEVLAFESDFYSLTKGWEAYKNGKQTIEEVENNIFSLWTRCDACKDLFTYIRNTQTNPSPLILTGFDSQIHGMYRRTHYREDFLNYLQTVSAPEKYAVQLDHLLSLVQTTYPLDKNTNITTDSLLFYGKIVDSLIEWNKQLPSDHYFTILTDNLKSYIEQGRFANEKSYEALTVRDRQMAANLKWISEHYYPGEKIIVWAHNYHVAKNTYDAMGPKSGRHLSMGNFLFQDLKEQMYILGFTSYEGTAGRLGTKPYAVQKPKKNSIENWLATKNSEYAFVDFRNYTSSQKEMFYMKGKFHNSALALWNEVFDGVFYIKHMYPCQLLPAN
jgi:erythromycin esterase